MYYTAQLFSAPSRDDKNAQKVTRTVNKKIIQGVINRPAQLSKLAQDLQLNWNKGKYSIKYFRPPETFGGEEIDPKTNRDIQREQLECGILPEIKNLVEFFESANHI